MARTKTPEPEIVDASPDLALVKSDGATVLGFLQPASLIAFFKRAGELERHAESLLSRAKAIQAPTNGEEDATVVRSMQAIKIAKAEAVEHWSARGVFFQLHKRLIAAEQRTTAMEDEAIEQLQRLHNTWTAEAKRQAQLEADVARRKAEAEARATREAELARLEAEAVKAEEGTVNLSEREERFVLFVSSGTAPDKAAEGAGFKDAWKSAARLMSLPKIQQAIKAKQDAIAIRRQAEAVKEQPLAVNMDPVVADVVKVGSDRTLKSAEIFDPEAFKQAVIEGKMGIPLDTLMTNQTVLNGYARSLGTLINAWPGVRLKTTTTTI